MKKLVIPLALVILLIACGSNAASVPTRAPSEPVPVTYYPTPTGTAQARLLAPDQAQAQTPLVTAASAPATPSESPTDTPTSLPTEAPPTEVSVPTEPPTPTEPATATTPPTQATATTISGCPSTSNAKFDVIPIDGGFYKNNAITDENADFRLSIIGYTPTDAQRNLIDLPGGADPNAPKLHGIFEPNRTPPIVATYKRYDWNWNESQPPPYGKRGGVNNDDQAPVAVVDLGTTPGEKIHIPERNASIFAGAVVAMVLYAGENELTLIYDRHDTVGGGYMVHMMNFCVDPSLVTAYRSQLENGKRKTGQLPAVRNNQPIGGAKGDYITIAIRDRARFLDPRSKKDWW